MVIIEDVKWCNTIPDPSTECAGHLDFFKEQTCMFTTVVVKKQ